VLFYFPCCCIKTSGRHLHLHALRLQPLVPACCAAGNEQRAASSACPSALCPLSSMYPPCICLSVPLSLYPSLSLSLYPWTAKSAAPPPPSPSDGETPIRATRWRAPLAPIVALASTSFANPAFSYLAVVLVSALS
jgi:hypothetical protein